MGLAPSLDNPINEAVYMKSASLIKGALIFIISGVYVLACSPVKFSASNEDSGNGVVIKCAGVELGGNLCRYSDNFTANGGKVDILIVNDNSASMSFEQKALATRFAGFLAQLDNKLVDYRIAMTTTDIHTAGDDNEPRSINGNGLLQNGGLLDFGNGIRYLTPQISDRATRFNNTIVRPETAQCEQFIANYVSQYGVGATTSTDYSAQYKANCPSGDERGIYAANLVVQNNPSSFIRSDASLAIIFLSDEDIRSGLYPSGNKYALETLDQPASLIENIESKYKKSALTQVHSIVVKDNSCLSQQQSQSLGSPPVPQTLGLVSGSIGSAYLTFNTSGWGKAVDICFNDYTNQLGEISTSIVEQKNTRILQCSNASSVSVSFVPQSGAVPYTVTGNELRFNQDIPLGTSVSISYNCPILN